MRMTLALREHAVNRGAPYGTEVGSEPYRKQDLVKAKQLIIDAGATGKIAPRQTEKSVSSWPVRIVMETCRPWAASVPRRRKPSSKRFARR